MSIATTCAVYRLSDGLIINCIVAEPSDPAPEGCGLAEIMNGQVCDIGWYCVDGVFHGPKKYAMCEDGTGAVVSFLSLSYVSPVPTAPTGYLILEVLPETACGIGWTWDGQKFNPPVG